MKQKCIIVGEEDEGDIQCLGILQRLLHAATDGMVVVFCLNEGNRNVRFIVEDIVSEIGFAAGDEFAPDNDSPFGEADLFANLRQLIPSCFRNGGRDEFRADVAFAQRFLVEVCHSRTVCSDDDVRGENTFSRTGNHPGLRGQGVEALRLTPSHGRGWTIDFSARGISIVRSELCRVAEGLG